MKPHALQWPTKTIKLCRGSSTDIKLGKYWILKKTVVKICNKSHLQYYNVE